MSETYSIWLVSDRESRAYRALDELIGDHARSYPDAPDFEPHITLLGGIEADEGRVVERTRDLARDCDPFELDFSDVSCSTTTHQCVFLLVTPSAELLRLRRSASESFGRDERMYVPHLSLVYSGMNIEDRVRLVRSIDTASLPDGVRIDTVEVVDTGGPVPEWRTVSTHPL
jgi:2'-5' RNA ligase